MLVGTSGSAGPGGFPTKNTLGDDMDKGFNKGSKSEFKPLGCGMPYLCGPRQL